MTRHPSPPDTNSLRLDKWLWAARFFKTRTLAVDAVTGGKVHLDGQRVKPSRQIRPGMKLRIHQGDIERTVVIVALNHQRRPAREAVLLYEETADSIAAREQHALSHTTTGKRDSGTGRPTKRDRRRLRSFRRD